MSDTHEAFTLCCRTARGLCWMMSSTSQQSSLHRHRQCRRRENASSQQHHVVACLCVALLAVVRPAAAAEPQQVLRAGSGLRQGYVKALQLTQKAACSRQFLGQSPLFKGEWVPSQVSSMSDACWPCCQSAFGMPPNALTALSDRDNSTCSSLNMLR